MSKRFQRPLPSFRPFKEVEAERGPPDEASDWHLTQTFNPDWTVGQGAIGNDWETRKTIEIDPDDPKRDPIDNYTLMISGIVPRPIGFISTISTEGKHNLATFSYTNMVNHDPPVVCVGFSGGSSHPKDTLKNILETGECVVNIISEDFVEAANFTCIDAPFGVSEWELSGLHQAPSAVVKPPRVAESRFSLECKLMHHHDFFNHAEGKNTGAMVILEGVRFHIAENALDPEHIMVDTNVLKPVARLGGITYARCTQGFEIPRPIYKHLKPEDLEKATLNKVPMPKDK